MKTKFLLMGVLLLQSVCTKKTTHQINLDCKAFNNQGMDSLMRYKVQFEKRRSTLESALIFFNQAIKCDSNFNIARYNKISTLGELGKYYEAIDAINDLERWNNDSSQLLRKASIYDIINEHDLAIRAYKQALNYYKAKLQEYPQSADFIYGKLLSQSMIFGKENVRPEIDYYLGKYPNDPRLKVLLEEVLR